MRHASRGHSGDAGGVFDNGDETPAFGLGKRPGFFDAYTVTNFGFALFIMSVKLFIAGDDLLEFWMREAALNPDDNGLRHFIANDFADAFFSCCPGQIGRSAANTRE